MGLRVGLVGSGAMAEYHFKRFSGMEGVSVSAVCDRVSNKAEAFAAALGIPRRFTDPESMFGSGEVDAVAIASWDGAHAEAALAALERGLPVFCEKPMARRLGDAEPMAAAAARARVPALVNFSKRNGGLLHLAASLAAEGALGRLVSLELQYLQSWVLQDSWGDWRTSPRWRWRLEDSRSTYGALGDLGSHLFDAALVLAGPRPAPAAVQGPTAGAAEQPRLEARSCSATRFVPPSGAVFEGPASFESFEARLGLGALDVRVRASWREAGSLDEFTARLVCEGGRIEVAPGRSRGSVRVVESSGAIVDVEAGSFVSTYERFASLVQGKARPDPGADPDFARGLAVQRVIADCARLAGSVPE